MKTLLKLFTFVLLAVAFSSQSIASPVIGEKAPSFKVKSITDGVEKSLEDFIGKIVVLEWTNADCPFVKKHYDSGNMQSLQKKYHEDEDVIWISIISSAEGKQGYVETDEEAYKIASDKGAMPNYIVRDPSGEIGKAYQAATTPHMFVINKEGNLAYQGAIDSIPTASQDDIEEAENYTDVAISSLKAGKEVKTSTSRPYGCSVKY